MNTIQTKTSVVYKFDGCPCCDEEVPEDIASYEDHSTNESPQLKLPLSDDTMPSEEKEKNCRDKTPWSELYEITRTVTI